MPYRKYLRSINNKFGFLATWLPNQKISLGDIGSFEKGVFRRQESLAGLGHELEEDSSGVPVDFDHSSASRISFGIGAQGSGSVSTILDSQHAKAQLEFGESGSYVLRAIGCIEHSLVSRAALRDAVTRLREDGRWHDDWVVVDQLYVASNLTLIVCNSSSGSLTLSASASAGAAQFDIARADAGVTASRWSGDITKVVASGGLVPMFSAARLRTGFFFGDRIDNARLPRLKSLPDMGGVVPVSLQDCLEEE